AIRGIDIGAENLQASESRIRDTNMANEMVKFVTEQILSQSGTAMLAQANQRATSVLQLLQ
ncbi:MAG: flagellin, partial [Spirochaetaceae bacterium]|nr:flagellin [Spirochaetaceae bacterium]